MLEVITEKLRPLFLRKFNNSKQRARATAITAGMTPRERKLYLSGFEHGWMQGAVDTTTVKASDLHPPDPLPPKTSKVH